MCRMLCVHQFMWCSRWRWVASGWVHRSSSLSGLVIGVLSVSWSSELL